MVFCSIARGPCQGRANCRLWIRGRILNTDSKLLAVKLSRFILNQDTSTNPKTLTPELTKAFWQDQGIANIQREVIIDRYLREKVIEVEELATQWVQSSGFHEKVFVEKRAQAKESPAPHTPRYKSLP